MSQDSDILENVEIKMELKLDSEDECYDGPFVLDLNEDALENLDASSDQISHKDSLPKGAEGKFLPRGRKPKPKGLIKQQRMCPICNQPHISTNFVRHLRFKHRIHDVETLAKYSEQASDLLQHGQSMPRPVNFDELPHIIKSHWGNKSVRMDTFKFLKKFHLFLAEDDID